MKFRLLGPLQIDGVRLPGARQQRALAMLLLEPNRVITVDRLIDCLWDTDPPATAREQIRNTMAALRRVLTESVVQEGPGYRLHVDPQTIDWVCFTTRTDEAKSAQPRAAHAAYVEALSLWRGDALSGLDSELLRAAAVLLDEQRLRAWEELAALRVDPASLLPDLAALVSAHPLRERLVVAYADALHRVGRSAEALTELRGYRDRLADEHGLDPGSAVAALEGSILAADGKPRTTPASLPAISAGFTGRTGPLTELEALRAAHPIVVVSGSAGVGKTTLAVRFGQTIAADYPDGQLFLNLRGYDPAEPVSPITALTRLLRSLGVPPDQIPADVDEAADLYRSTLAGRRVLIVLDNAASLEQVQALLPGTPDCLVLLTSRHRLSALVRRFGAGRLALDRLPRPESLALLARIVGAQRMEQEPHAAAELAETCADLPLALTITATTLADHPHRSIAEHVRELRVDRLSGLELADDAEGVRAAFDQSYRRLAPAEQRLFRLLGVVCCEYFTPAAVAALAAAPVESLLDRLAAANLLSEAQPGRFTMHDLLRDYAAELSEPDPERGPAAERLCEWYCELTEAANRLIFPGLTSLPGMQSAPAQHFTDALEATSWMDGEWPNIRAVSRFAAEHGLGSAPWRMAHVLRFHFWSHHLAAEGTAISEAALKAATASGDSIALAAANSAYGVVLLSRGEPQTAMAPFRLAVRHTRKARWWESHMVALSNLASCYLDTGRPVRAITLTRRAIALARCLGHRAALALNLADLGDAYGLIGQLPEALAAHTEGLAIMRRISKTTGLANALAGIGFIEYELGDYASSLEHLTECERLAEETRFARVQSYALTGLAGVQLALGDAEQSLRHAHAAFQVAQTSGVWCNQASALAAIGAAHRANGDLPDAIAAFRSGHEVAAAHWQPQVRVKSLLWLALLTDVRAHAEEALTLTRELGIGLLEPMALAALAEICRREGDLDEAASHAQQAQVLFDKIGKVPGREMLTMMQ